MTRDERLAQAIDDLIAEYLAEGCPCRFPRFRATVARDTSGVAGGTFVADDLGDTWSEIGTSADETHAQLSPFEDVPLDVTSWWADLT